MFAGVHGSPPTTLVLTERSNPLTSTSYLLLFSDGTRQASIHIASRLSTHRRGDPGLFLTAPDSQASCDPILMKNFRLGTSDAMWIDVYRLMDKYIW